jgi:hypothetical protein
MDIPKQNLDTIETTKTGVDLWKEINEDYEVKVLRNSTQYKYLSDLFFNH